MYKIGEVARRTGLDRETIRYYEQVGVLPAAERAANGYRLYGSEHLRRLHFIKRTRELGFSLKDVRSLLRLADARSGTCQQVQQIAQAHLTDVRQRIADLQAIERSLVTTMAPCPGDSSAHCPILDVFFGLSLGRPAASETRPKARHAADADDLHSSAQEEHTEL